VIPHAEQAGELPLVYEAIGNLCSIGAFGPANVAVAEEEIRALLDRARSISSETTAYRALGRLAAIRGGFEEARELSRRGREPLLDAGLVLFYAATCLSAAFVEEQAGDLEAAARFHREGFAQLAELGEHAFASTVAATLARTLLRLDRDDEVERWLATARDLCPAGDIATFAIADSVEGLFHLRRGRLEEAERLVRRGLEHAETTDFWEMRGNAREALAQVLSAKDHGENARATVKAALEIYEAKGAAVPARRAEALLAEL
jgi:ATP/maltotriose-dependent transcriptional regulator MalT